MITVKPFRNGAFPMVPRNEPFQLVLGNGTMFIILVHVGAQGMFVAVERHGAYTFATVAHAPYVSQKLNILEGDAVPMARFINDQNR